MLSKNEEVLYENKFELKRKFYPGRGFFLFVFFNFASFACLFGLFVANEILINS